MTREEAIKILTLFREKWDRHSKTPNAKALDMAIAALQEPERSYDEIMVGDIIKNFGCEYEVYSMSHIKDELFISAYRIRGEEE